MITSCFLCAIAFELNLPTIPYTSGGSKSYMNPLQTLVLVGVVLTAPPNRREAQKTVKAGFPPLLSSPYSKTQAANFLAESILTINLPSFGFFFS